MASVVFVQCQVSQLDEPVYARMHEIEPQSVAVVYWNDYGFSRKWVDPEMGIVPVFSEAGVSEYPKTWIDRRAHGHKAVLAAVLAAKPRIAVLADQPQLARLRLATALRRHGIRVALRVDKNQLSEKPRHGATLAIERQFTRRVFDVLAPTSPLTNAYYSWPNTRPSVLSPYATNERKFSPGTDVQARKRAEVRASLGLAEEAFVFISATKFSPRESPWELVESYARVASAMRNVHLLALGDGPMLPEIKRACAERGIDRVTFPGFVPFCALQNYFFAADAFLHLVSVGPWEVSPQDALVAGLGLATTENVGSARVFLKGALQRFLVPFGDRALIAERMRELASNPDSPAWFAPARALTGDYTVDATARRWLGAVV